MDDLVRLKVILALLQDMKLVTENEFLTPGIKAYLMEAEDKKAWDKITQQIVNVEIINFKNETITIESTDDSGMSELRSFEEIEFVDFYEQDV